jgi:hypothetical protein
MAEAGKPASSAPLAATPERVAFTMDVGAGSIIKLESVDAAGQRRELSNTEREELAMRVRGPGVVGLLERAFEAGIACLLDADQSKDDEQETDDEASFRRILLKELMGESSPMHVMRPEILRLAIVQSLIQDVSSSGELESKPQKAEKSDHVAPKTSTRAKGESNG